MKKLSPEMSAELRRAVKAFNRKIRRLEAKGVTASLLPEKASAKALKNAYKDSESLRQRLDMMASFSSKGATRRNRQGVVGTDAMFEYRKKENAEGIKIYRQQLEQASHQKTRYKSRLREYKRNLQSKIKYLGKDVEKIDARTMMRQYQNNMTNERLFLKNKTYRNNFMDKLDEYAEIGEINPKKLKLLKSKLGQIPVDDFYRITTSNPEFENIKNYMLDSPSIKKGKMTRPKYEKEDIQTEIDDLLLSIDDIIANSL